MRAYYNEFDPAAAAVLRQLIADHVIAPGEVDTRSIKEVQPDDLRGFTQCHFFAGGGLWSLACRMAGWPDARPIWTGSCPCQPFSAAGKGGGTDDPRHLWPDFHRLIRARRPPVVVGEQVAGSAGYGWFDGVRADLEREGYAGRAVDFPACAVDAPHQRNRLYWAAVGLADAQVSGRGSGLRQDGSEQNGALAANGNGSQRHVDLVDAEGFRRSEGRAKPIIYGGRPATAGTDAPSVTLGDAECERLEGQSGHGDDGRGSQQDRPVAAADGAGAASVVQADGNQPLVQGQSPAGQQPFNEQDARTRGRNGTHWSDAEWLICHDGKARRAKPDLRLLVDGLPGRVDLWRVGGNAIVPQAAVEAISALMDVLDMECAA